jgi:hypothetical protein
MNLFLLLIVFLIPVNGLTSPAEEREEKDILVLEKAKELFGIKANLVADRLDSFFATERADDEFGRSRIRVRSQFVLRDGSQSDLMTQYRINLRLPSLEEKFRFKFQNQKKDSSQTTEKMSSENQNLQNKKWFFNSDIGVSMAIPPKLITRARLRRNFNSDIFTHRFYEQLTYITDESGLVEDTGFDSDYVFNSDLIFRFVNFKRWQVLKKNFNTNHGPTLIHRVSDNQALNYGITGQTTIIDGAWYLHNYRLAVNYRRNLYKQWMYFDMVPGLDFPKTRSFKRTPFILFQLELLFGGR